MIGRKIKMLKRALRCSQESLANLLGVSQTIISNWEQNYDKPSLKRLEDLQRLCDKKEINIRFL